MSPRVVATTFLAAALLAPAAAAGTAPTFLTSVRDVYPVLSPDGTTLLFQSNRDGTMDIYRQPWQEP